MLLYAACLHCGGRLSYHEKNRRWWHMDGRPRNHNGCPACRMVVKK